MSQSITYDRHVIEYKFIIAWKVDDFEKEVQEAVKDGWQLYGTVRTVKDSDGDIGFYRELVKYETTEEDIHYGIGVYAKEPPCEHQWVNYRNADDSIFAIECSVCGEAKDLDTNESSTIDESVNKE